jgi:hypothetical protein
MEYLYFNISEQFIDPCFNYMIDYVKFKQYEQVINNLSFFPLITGILLMIHAWNLKDGNFGSTLRILGLTNIFLSIAMFFIMYG